MCMYMTSGTPLMWEAFSRRRLETLQSLYGIGGQDNSLKGSVDAHLSTAVNIINCCQELFTTSCCSGRITIFLDGSTHKKNAGRLVLSTHDVLERPSDQEGADIGSRCLEDWIWKDISYKLKSSQVTAYGGHKSTPGLLESFELDGFPIDTHEERFSVEAAADDRWLWLVSEPFILHIEVASTRLMNELMCSLKSNGIKQTMILSQGRRNLLLVKGTQQLRAPIGYVYSTESGLQRIRLIVSRPYLRQLVRCCNQKLTANFSRVDLLEKTLWRFATSGTVLLDQRMCSSLGVNLDTSEMSLECQSEWWLPVQLTGRIKSIRKALEDAGIYDPSRDLLDIPNVHGDGLMYRRSPTKEEPWNKVIRRRRVSSTESEDFDSPAGVTALLPVKNVSAETVYGAIKLHDLSALWRAPDGATTEDLFLVPPKDLLGKPRKSLQVPLVGNYHMTTRESFSALHGTLLKLSRFELKALKKWIIHRKYLTNCPLKEGEGEATLSSSEENKSLMFLRNRLTIALENSLSAIPHTDGSTGGVSDSVTTVLELYRAFVHPKKASDNDSRAMSQSERGEGLLDPGGHKSTDAATHCLRNEGKSPFAGAVEEMLRYFLKYERLGDVVIFSQESGFWISQFRDFLKSVTSDYSPLWTNICEAFEAKSLGIQGYVTGDKRDSNVTLIYGDCGRVTHREGDVIYCFDVTTHMFSSGNTRERMRLPFLFGYKTPKAARIMHFCHDVERPTTEASDCTVLLYPSVRATEARIQDATSDIMFCPETFVDMYCGVGYFSLPLAVHVSVEKVRAIWAFDHNPSAVEYLKEGLSCNSLYFSQGECYTRKGKPITTVRVGNSHLLGLPHGPDKGELARRANRVSLGMLPMQPEGLAAAGRLAHPVGCVMHVHDLWYKNALLSHAATYERCLLYLDQLKEVLPPDWGIKILDVRKVKSFSSSKMHVVIDILVKKSGT